MLEPKGAHLGSSGLGHCFNNASHLVEVLHPDILGAKQVNVHQLDRHLGHSHVHLAELAVLRDEVVGSGLGLLDVGLNLNGVVPGNRSLLVAFGVLNEVLKHLHLFKHHGDLALDHLRVHRVVEVGHLFQSHTFLVEFFGVLRDVVNRLRDFEPVLTQHACIFNQSHKLVRVVYLEQLGGFKVEFHKLAGHFVLMLFILVGEGSFDFLNPLLEESFFELPDLLAQVAAVFRQTLHAT
jgi:hypothetical protein